MFRGIYNALSGMNVQQARMDVISNNLANVNTNGYKSEQVLSKTFGEVLLSYRGPLAKGTANVGTTNLGTVVSQVPVNQAQGQLVSTEKLTDLALEGRGFFVVQRESADGQQLYTRNGSFSVNSEGYLITAQGDLVLGDSGPIKVGSEEFTVDEDGRVSADGKQIAVLKVVGIDAAGQEQLQKVGENYFAAQGNLETAEDKPKVRQGYIEKSNVDVVNEIVSLLSVQRSYEAGQKIIQAQDELLGKAVNQIGTLR